MNEIINPSQTLFMFLQKACPIHDLFDSIINHGYSEGVWESVSYFVNNCSGCQLSNDFILKFHTLDLKL